MVKHCACGHFWWLIFSLLDGKERQTGLLYLGQGMLVGLGTGGYSSACQPVSMT